MGLDRVMHGKELDRELVFDRKTAGLDDSSVYTD